MAVVQDVFVAELNRTVFTKPPDIVRQYSPWPRAIANFSVLNGAVSAKPVNDQLEMQISVVLDPTFAYKMFDWNISVQQDTAFQWDDRAFIEVVDGVKNLPGGNQQRHAVALVDVNDSIATGQMWIANSDTNIPRYVIQASGGNTIFWNFFAINTNNNVGAAGSLNCNFRFWEYEIEQVEYYALHYATMTVPSH